MAIEHLPHKFVTLWGVSQCEHVNNSVAVVVTHAAAAFSTYFDVVC